jgi:hypothetical protein
VRRTRGPVARARQVLEGIALTPIDDAILRGAGDLSPAGLRTLDAIHLAGTSPPRMSPPRHATNAWPGGRRGGHRGDCTRHRLGQPAERSRSTLWSSNTARSSSRPPSAST